MNAKQEAKLNMFRATQKHCNDNAAVIATVPAFQTAFAAFNVKLSAIISTAQQEDLVTKGITVDKAESKKTLCSLAADIAAAIFAFASAGTNHTLKQEVNFSYSTLIRTKDDLLAPRCQNIKDIGTANLAALAPYGLTAPGLNALQTEIDNYQLKVPTPRNSAANKKTIRENLKRLMLEADTVLKDQMDKSVLVLKTTNPDFVSTYRGNRIIIDPGQIVTTLKGTVKNAVNNTPVAAASIKILETGQVLSTDASGNFLLKPIIAAVYTIQVSATGYMGNVANQVTIKQGQTTTLNLLLQPAGVVVG